MDIFPVCESAPMDISNYSSTGKKVAFLLGISNNRVLTGSDPDRLITLNGYTATHFEWFVFLCAVLRQAYHEVNRKNSKYVKPRSKEVVSVNIDEDGICRKMVAVVSNVGKTEAHWRPFIEYFPPVVLSFCEEVFGSLAGHAGRKTLCNLHAISQVWPLVDISCLPVIDHCVQVRFRDEPISANDRYYRHAQEFEANIQSHAANVFGQGVRDRVLDLLREKRTATFPFKVPSIILTAKDLRQADKLRQKVEEHAEVKIGDCLTSYLKEMVAGVAASPGNASLVPGYCIMYLKAGDFTELKNSRHPYLLFYVPSHILRKRQSRSIPERMKRAALEQYNFRPINEGRSQINQEKYKLFHLTERAIHRTCLPLFAEDHRWLCGHSLTSLAGFCDSTCPGVWRREFGVDGKRQLEEPNIEFHHALKVETCRSVPGFPLHNESWIWPMYNCDHAQLDGMDELEMFEYAEAVGWLSRAELCHHASKIFIAIKKIEKEDFESRPVVSEYWSEKMKKYLTDQTKSS